MNRETSQPDETRHELVVRRSYPDDLERWCGELTRAFGEASAAQREFVRRFPDWLECRNESISRLKKIANVINQSKQSATISRIVGSSASIVGGIGMVTTTAALLPLVPVFAVPLVAAAPALLLTAGTSASLGSLAMEEYWKEQRVKEVKKILEEDGEETTSLIRIMDRNKDLITKIEQVMSIDVFGEIIGEFIQFENAVIGDKDSNTETSANQKLLQRMLNMCSSIVSLEPEALIVVNFLITEGYLVKLMNYYKSRGNSNAVVRECISATVKAAMLLAPTISEVANAANFVLAGGVPNSTLSRNMNPTGKSLTLNLQSLTASLGVALDAVNLFLGARDLYNRTPSECAAKIQSAVEGLEAELVKFSNINTMLRNCFIPEVAAMTDCLVAT